VSSPLSSSILCPQLGGRFYYTMELLYGGHSRSTVCPDQQPVQYPHFARRILCELWWDLIKCPVFLHVILGCHLRQVPLYIVVSVDTTCRYSTEMWYVWAQWQGFIWGGQASPSLNLCWPPLNNTYCLCKANHACPPLLCCAYFPPPLTGFLNEMLSGTPLKLSTSVLCIQQVTTAFPQLLGQTHFSERFFISTSANTDCIHQLILMA